MSLRPTLKFLGLVAFVALVGAGCTVATQNIDTASSGIGSEKTERAPDFSLKDYNGKTVSLDDFKGQPILINSWATWCPFCVKELPDFVSAQKEFGSKVTIIAINRAESIDVAKGYTDEQGNTNDLVYLLDPKDSFYRSIGGFAMPETIFVDSEGQTVFHKRGPMDLTEIRQRINNLIK